jgi:hypothetical protein
MSILRSTDREILHEVADDVASTDQRQNQIGCTGLAEGHHMMYGHDLRHRSCELVRRPV